ncbi:aminodeoxychorismate lyase [Corynebacterium tapiri]|uniref:Aminodeoxychorismate lyase n=1 Tax=Corynebacterium tapiri TaxID=1448266 RepID=A0A5C4U351_9CORY|nr:aminodeoxychorismate lyase [Corynebacterium tapiri]TNL96106.1 aminodeoxychorismate lyase [Corynebacterium tapiri]
MGPKSPITYIIEPFGGSVRRHNPALPHLYFDDAAVTRGDGVFESLLITEGRPANLARHMRRFAHSVEQLDLPKLHCEQWEEATRLAAQEWAQTHGDAQARCTWTLSRGRASTGLATAWLVLEGLSPSVETLRAEGVKAMLTSRGMTPDEKPPKWMPQGAKTLSYTMTAAALRHARENGWDDVVFTNERGTRLIEGATSSLVVVRAGKKLRTPPASEGGLESTTVAAVREHAEDAGWRFKERVLPLDYVLESDSVWLLSSTRGAVRIRRLGEHKLKAGELDDKAQSLFEQALCAP